MRNNINDRIKNISDYFSTMQVTNIDGQQIIYVIVTFPNKWMVPEETEERFNVSIGKQGNSYYYCATIEDGFETIFDAIDYTIEKMISAQERANLLREKAVELQKLFADETISLDALKEIEFTLPKKKSQKKSSGRKHKEQKPIEEEIVVTTEIENNEPSEINKECQQD